VRKSHPTIPGGSVYLAYHFSGEFLCYTTSKSTPNTSEKRPLYKFKLSRAPARNPVLFDGTALGHFRLARLNILELAAPRFKGCKEPLRSTAWHDACATPIEAREICTIIALMSLDAKRSFLGIVLLQSRNHYNRLVGAWPALFRTLQLLHNLLLVRMASTYVIVDI
jgi:hypothetical protein